MEESDDDDEENVPAIKLAPSPAPSGLFPPALLAILGDMNTTSSSRLSAIAVGVEKLNATLVKMLAFAEKKDREDKDANLKRAVSAATSSSDVPAVLVSLCSSCSCALKNHFHGFTCSC